LGAVEQGSPLLRGGAMVGVITVENRVEGGGIDEACHFWYASARCWSCSAATSCRPEANFPAALLARRRRSSELSRCSPASNRSTPLRTNSAIDTPSWAA